MQLLFKQRSPLSGIRFWQSC